VRQEPRELGVVSIRQYVLGVAGLERTKDEALGRDRRRHSCVASPEGCAEAGEHASWVVVALFDTPSYAAQVWTRESLAAHIAGGGAAKFLFFWGHTPKHEGVIDASCLSQWFPRGFEIDGVRYRTAEHWMMASKARLFGDRVALSRIVSSRTPAEAKEIGRTVRDYDDDVWERARFDAVVRGNVAKFGQHSDLGRFLAATSDRVLVEASPRDCVWGIGLGAKDPLARDPARWRGRNLLGFALMQAREELA